MGRGQAKDSSSRRAIGLAWLMKVALSASAEEDLLIGFEFCESQQRTWAGISWIDLAKQGLVKSAPWDQRMTCPLPASLPRLQRTKLAPVTFGAFHEFHL